MPDGVEEGRRIRPHRGSGCSRSTSDASLSRLGREQESNLLLRDCSPFALPLGYPAIERAPGTRQAAYF